MNIVISSGHGKLVRGATGYIDEVDEARKVVNRIGELLGHSATVFHDDVSKSQGENLDRIVDYHNSKERDLDVSVHFNAYETTSGPMGCEVLYVTQPDLASKVAAAISKSGLKNRGAKKRTDLAFLNGTEQPAILIETCFVDSGDDVAIYEARFDQICVAIAEAISGQSVGEPEPEPPEPEHSVFAVSGKVSYFGGPNDEGVSADEGLAFIGSVEEAPHLFLPYQPEGTTGLARRLNPYVSYVACRWDYDKTPKSVLREGVALVRALRTGVCLKAFPSDWGPHEDTGRVADVSPWLMAALGITTDDEVAVVFPAV